MRNNERKSFLFVRLQITSANWQHSITIILNYLVGANLSNYHFPLEKCSVAFYIMTVNVFSGTQRGMVSMVRNSDIRDVSYTIPQTLQQTIRQMGNFFRNKLLILMHQQVHCISLPYARIFPERYFFFSTPSALFISHFVTARATLRFYYRFRSPFFSLSKSVMEMRDDKDI